MHSEILSLLPATSKELGLFTGLSKRDLKGVLSELKKDLLVTDILRADAPPNGGPAPVLWAAILKDKPPSTLCTRVPGGYVLL